MAYNRKLLYTKSFPSWNTPEGILGDVFNDQAMTPIQLVATEINEPGSTITYAVTAGALPTGLTLSSSGEISGTVTGYATPETASFTITATDDEGETAVRDFSLKVLTPYEANFLVVAGGGGGGWDVGGGGGGGGLRTSYGSVSGGGSSSEPNVTFIPNSVYSITVGLGGAGATGGEGSAGMSQSGGDSSIIGNGVNIVSLGGGYGGNYSGGDGGTGGSGGGGSAYSSTNPGGAGTPGQGYKGGDVNTQSTAYAGAGGGGAAGAGSNGAQTSNVAGGPGLAVSITGSSVAYSAGGQGRQDSATTGVAGAANSGNGGCGAGYPNQGKNGGSGVVVLRMQTFSYTGITTGSPTVSTIGSETILKYTGSGTYTA